MNLHVFDTDTAFGKFKVAVSASEFSRADAISVVQAEFRGISSRVSQTFERKRKLPGEASEAFSAKGWAWVWRSK